MHRENDLWHLCLTRKTYWIKGDNPHSLKCQYTINKEFHLHSVEWNGKLNSTEAFLLVQLYASCLLFNLNWDLHRPEWNPILKRASDRAPIHAVDWKMQTETIWRSYFVLTRQLRMSSDYLNMVATNDVEQKYQISFRLVTHIYRITILAMT